MTSVVADSPMKVLAVREAIAGAIKAGTLIGFDVETHGPYIQHPKVKRSRKPDALRHRIVGYGVSVGASAWYVPLRHGSDPTGAPRCGDLAAAPAHKLLRFLQQPAAQVVCHNWGFEAQVMRNEGIDVRCVKLDSLLGAWMRGMRLQGNSGLKLKPLMEFYFNRKRPDFDAVMRGRPVYEVPAAEVGPYCAADCTDAVALWTRAWSELSEDERRDYLELEAPTIDVIVHMQAVGVDIDRTFLRDVAVSSKSRMADLRDRFERLTRTEVEELIPAKRPKACPARHAPPAVCSEPGCVGGVLYYKNGKPKVETAKVPAAVERGADIGSSQQVSRWLWDELGWWPKRGAVQNDTGYSTKAEHIKPFVGLAGEAGYAARLRLEYQGLSKYAELYTTGLISLADQWEDLRLHTSYLQHGTDTQRFSSSFPNIANIPRDGRKVDVPAVREAFVAPEGWVCISRDFSQAELRVLAHYSQDPLLLKVYRENGDIHSLTVQALGIERPEAKITNFCQDPDTRVLCADLTWKKSGDVAVGDRLVGFDETLGRHARYRETVVEATKTLRRTCYTVHTTHGSMTASAEHQWVVRAGGRHWARTDELRAGDKLAFMVKPWDVDASRDGGWLAGMFDGEGHLGARGQLGVAQNPGPILERLRNELAKRDLGFSENVNRAPGRCTQLQLRGDGAALRAVGMLRPERMLASSARLWLGRRACHPHATPCLVLAVEPAGERAVVATQTTERTLITEGFLTHNSCIYRITAPSLAVKLTFFTGKRYTPTQAQAIIDSYYSRYPRVGWYHEKAISYAKQHGYAKTLTGFRAPLTEWEGRLRHYTENRAINYPIQGSVGGILKRALVALYREWSAAGVLGLPGAKGVRVAIQAQTYDSINVIARADFAEEANATMQRVMEGAAPELTVPLKTDGGVGPNWAAAK